MYSEEVKKYFENPINMGIIEGVKLLNNNPETTENIKNILTNFIHFQENNVERLKKYL